MTAAWVEDLLRKRDDAARIVANDIHPEAYLPTPPEVLEAVEREVARLKTIDGIEVDPSTQRRMLADSTLYYHFAGREIACKRTDRGVIVLAVGPDEVNAMLNAIPPDQRPGVVIEYP
jgi:hypothetical protein